ncbi:MAG: tyrosinase family protein [Acidobacteriota bacterium]
MEKLKNLPCSNPLSWYYQGAMHWVPNDERDGSKLVDGAVLCPSYNGTDEKLKPAWNNCTHKPGTELHFLIWHRLYIYHLELIVKEQGGDPEFGLPYWDYTNPQYRVMPGAFRDADGSLYEAGRFPPLNRGEAIDSRMDRFLDLTKLMQNRTYESFNSTIDGAPHGAMHVYIGTGYEGFRSYNRVYQTQQSGLMAEVPSAGFDPVFWVHHSNIDFIWQSWMNSPNGAFPDLEQLEASPIPYQFFDPEGNLVSYTVQEAYDKAFGLPVTYDVFQAGESEVMPRFDFDGKGRVTTFTIDLADSSRVLAVKNEKRIYMRVVVSFAREPTSAFEVYVSNSGGRDVESVEQLAGLMTFFGAQHHAAHHPGHGVAGHGGRIQKEFRFDVTDEVDPNNLEGKADIHIRKVGDPEDSDEVTIEKIVFETE